LAIVKSIQHISSSLPFQVSFDSGLDNTFIHQNSLPPGATSKVIRMRSGQTLAGLLSISREVDLQELILPKFSHSCCVNQQHAFIFDGSCDYNIVLGQDFLQTIGMEQDFNLGMMTAFDITLEMKHKSFYSNALQALSHIVDDDIRFKQDDCFHSMQKPILESKYDKADLEKVIAEQKHLTQLQKTELHAVLEKQEKLFLRKTWTLSLQEDAS
jgi:hypothetical protein